MRELVPELSGNGLLFTRQFDAERALVYRAFTDPEVLKMWWGPEGYPVHYSSQDLREGGIWHYSMRSSETGEEYWSRNTYLTIKEPELLIFEDVFSDEAGNINSEMPQGQVTLSFIRDSNLDSTSSIVTLVHMKNEYRSQAERDQVLSMGMSEGLGIAFAQLDEVLATLQT